MGQRGNYIIKNNNTLRIRYTHWRANRIIADLYQGEKVFMRYLHDCKSVEEILEEPWIEGCVIIDQDNKELSFWSQEIFFNHSIIQYYLKKLQEKWPGWSINLLRNRMYDVEKLLNIDYISKQAPTELNTKTVTDLKEDKVEEWDSALVIIKDETGMFITRTGNISTESIVCLGPVSLEILRTKEPVELPSREDRFPMGTIIIDTKEKRVLINESSYGLWEQTKHLWNGYTFLMGDLSGGELLQLAGIDVNLETPSEAEILEEFAAAVKQGNDFDPLAMAETLTRDNQAIQFHPDFFDSAKPRQTFLEKIVSTIKRITAKR